MLSEVLYDSVVAGHLQEYKWPKGANVREVERRVRVALDPAPGEEVELELETKPEDEKMASKKPVANPYNLEEVISLNFDLVKSELDRDIGMMKAKSIRRSKPSVWRWLVKRNPLDGGTPTRQLSTKWMITRNFPVQCGCQPQRLRRIFCVSLGNPPGMAWESSGAHSVHETGVDDAQWQGYSRGGSCGAV